MVLVGASREKPSLKWASAKEKNCYCHCRMDRYFSRFFYFRNFLSALRAFPWRGVSCDFGAPQNSIHFQLRALEHEGRKWKLKKWKVKILFFRRQATCTFWLIPRSNFTCSNGAIKISPMCNSSLNTSSMKTSLIWGFSFLLIYFFKNINCRYYSGSVYFSTKAECVQMLLISDTSEAEKGIEVKKNATIDFPETK